MTHARNIISIVGNSAPLHFHVLYHGEISQYMCGDVQYPYIYYDILHATEYPPQYWTSPTVLNIPHGTQDIPHSTQDTLHSTQDMVLKAHYTGWRCSGVKKFSTSVFQIYQCLSSSPKSVIRTIPLNLKIKFRISSLTFTSVFLVLTTVVSRHWKKSYRDYMKKVFISADCKTDYSQWQTEIEEGPVSKVRSQVLMVIQNIPL